jgi:hypothetical protein
LTTKPRNGVLVNFQSRVWDTASGAIFYDIIIGDRERVCVYGAFSFIV